MAFDDDTVSIVVGGSSGIGRAVVQALEQRPGRVVAASRASGLDVTDSAAVQRYFRTAGAFDHLVLTAGPDAPGGRVDAVDIDAAKAAFEVKFWGMLAVVRAAAPQVRAGGSITLTSGFLARRTTPGTFVKTAMNAATEAVGKILARELAPLRVNVVSPGLTDTEAYAGMDPAARASMLARAAASLPAGRVAQPEDVARGYLFAIDSPSMTGAVIDIDGGALIGSPAFDQDAGVAEFPPRAARRGTLLTDTATQGVPMKAIGYREPGAIDRDDALIELELPEPTPGPRDLLVEVRAISVNPVDTKVRASTAPEPGQAKVLGWDVAGVVCAVGAKASLFRPGDEVFYAGAIDRPGGNSERHVVDERIAGRKPVSLDFAHAAALPLTAITAWELLFDRLGVAHDGGAGQSLLVVGAAGGVGSILVQLACQLTRLKVIGTASRQETQAWVKDLGAHEVIDHRKPIAEELKRIGVPQADRIASLTHTDDHYAQLVEAIAPQGKLALIDDPETLDASPLKRKSASLHWEFMFVRPLFHTPDMIKQHELLDEVARLIDTGTLKTTLGEHFGRIDAANLKRAHALLESGRAKGKIVLEGF